MRSPADLVAERVKRIPPYPFAVLEKKVSELEAKGVDVLNLSIGDPDLPPPPPILRSLATHAKDPTLQGYSSSRGESSYLEAVAKFYEKRFGARVDPTTQVCSLLGSKEGIANLTRAFVNPDDVVLCPDPGYPVYSRAGSILNDARSLAFPLDPAAGFAPDWEAAERAAKDAGEKARLVFLNYPNNPTGGTVELKNLERAVEFARNHGLLLAYDNAYSEMVFGDYRAPSILQVQGADEVAVEFGTLSKTFNMTGSRIGWAVGNRDAVAALAKVKSQVDSGNQKYVQAAGVDALAWYSEDAGRKFLAKMNRIYQRRFRALIGGLKRIGIKSRMPRGTFYLFVRAGDKEEDANALLDRLLSNGVVATPGGAFGARGANYVRFALTASPERIAERFASISN
ncbi:MAG TPA: aminotransferase class I/II-fold pyridoxal phosphate-dependent enzyme [Thermoplasmata archaeon]|nr:aminotransferase class I/II-fold pyridoxal phosphate-dependent enzyme [Thermoplasmata archaeon]